MFNNSLGLTENWGTNFIRAAGYDGMLVTPLPVPRAF
jgi:hypothetical protein